MVAQSTYVRKAPAKDRVKSASAFTLALSNSHLMPYHNLQRHLLNDRESSLKRMGI